MKNFSSLLWGWLIEAVIHTICDVAVWVSVNSNKLSCPVNNCFLLPVPQDKQLEAYSISFGQSLLYNNIFPKHRDRLGKKLSELVRTVAKTELPAGRTHFDIVVACEDEDGEDVDAPLVSIRYA